MSLLRVRGDMGRNRSRRGHESVVHRLACFISGPSSGLPRLDRQEVDHLQRIRGCSLGMSEETMNRPDVSLFDEAPLRQGERNGKAWLKRNQLYYIARHAWAAMEIASLKALLGRLVEHKSQEIRTEIPAHLVRQNIWPLQCLVCKMLFFFLKYYFDFLDPYVDSISANAELLSKLVDTWWFLFQNLDRNSGS